MLKNEWIKVSDRLPEPADNKQYLVNKRYDWERGDRKGSFYQVQILVYNPYHECWDGEDGDDYDCDINQVTHWMPLPEPPTT